MQHALQQATATLRAMSLKHSQKEITKNRDHFYIFIRKTGENKLIPLQMDKRKPQPPKPQCPPLTVTKVSKADLSFKCFQVQVSFCNVGTDFQILNSFCKKYLKYMMLLLHFFTPWSMCNVGEKSYFMVFFTAEKLR